MRFPIPLKLSTEPIQIYKNIEVNGVRIDVLRLDNLHPVASGNKVFKLLPYIDEVMKTDHRTLLTFGGAWSNHLHATAYLCKELNIKSIGVVRGRRHEMNSKTIADCERMGMELHFVERSVYQVLSENDEHERLSDRFGQATVVPTGGYGRKGVIGASFIADSIPDETYSHICVSVGTATTLAGILKNMKNTQVMAFPALKGMTDIAKRLHHLGITETEDLKIISDYHFGGFARYNTELIDFMNRIYIEFQLSLDRVYTAKMMYGIVDLAKAGYFAPGSIVLAIHTGGLQGNASLPANTLFY